MAKPHAAANVDRAGSLVVAHATTDLGSLVRDAADAEPHCGVFGHADAHAETHPDALANRNTVADRNRLADAYAAPHGNAVAHAYAMANSYALAHSYALANSYAGAHSNTDDRRPYARSSRRTRHRRRRSARPGCSGGHIPQRDV